MKPLLRITILCFSLFFSSLGLAEDDSQPSWNAWVQQVRKEAIAEGIDPQLFDRVFADIKPDHKTLHLDRTQPERRITFDKYRQTRGDAYRINLGVKKYKRYQNLLDEIGDQYGVDPCMITALWGIESSYGHFKGNFPVIKSLATLAYDPRRGDFFRKELFDALHILNGHHVSEQDFKGEWAGASGHPQFLPSSWKRYAVDYDQDGYKDIWNNLGDVFASIANYLVQNGWQTNQPWGFEVRVPLSLDPELIGKETKLTVAQWQDHGVVRKDGQPMPDPRLEASIIQPYGGPHLMVFQNFATIKRYNNSNFYAGTVGYISDEICKKLHRY